MCGIVGYIGSKPVLPILLDGLKKLEYRGYDSAGVSFVSDGTLQTVKAAGKIVALEKNSSLLLGILVLLVLAIPVGLPPLPQVKMSAFIS